MQGEKPDEGADIDVTEDELFADVIRDQEAFVETLRTEEAEQVLGGMLRSMGTSLEDVIAVGEQRLQESRDLQESWGQMHRGEGTLRAPKLEEDETDAEA
jgi:Flp pilus assembly CpaF family ATPase